MTLGLEISFITRGSLISFIPRSIIIRLTLIPASSHGTHALSTTGDFAWPPQESEACCSPSPRAQGSGAGHAVATTMRPRTLLLALCLLAGPGCARRNLNLDDPDGGASGDLGDVTRGCGSKGALCPPGQYCEAPSSCSLAAGHCV